MIGVEVEIEEALWSSRLIGIDALVTSAVIAALGDQPDGEVTVLLADDAALAELNGQFRGKPLPTNVLSFPAAASARPHLGDIALAFGVCDAEATAQGKPLAHHLQHLVVHGTLHLMGYDHQSDDEAEAMEGRERVILASLGVPDPYAATAELSAASPEHRAG